MVSLNRIAHCLTNQRLSLILMPTEQCNFRCTYCYEDFLIGKMTPEIIQGIKQLIKHRAPELKFLSIEWFGGEPLSARDVIYDIGHFIQEAILPQHPSIKYVSGMTTNGYNLGPKVADRLLNLDIRNYQISLDGPRDIHNQTRLRIDGQGSFDTIWSNLQAMQQLDQSFCVTLRVHVTPENYTSLGRLIQAIKTHFGGDQRFQVFFKPIEDLGGPNSGTFNVLKDDSKKAILAELYEQIGDENNISPLQDIENPQTPYICYASKPNNLVIRANGTIAKCTVAFSDDRNAIGQLHSDGTLTIDSEKLNLWVRGMKTLDETTLHCPLQGLPKLNRQKIGDIPVVEA